jgi:hypothetical protein
MHSCHNCGKFISMDWEPGFPDFCTYGCKFEYNVRGGAALNEEAREKNLQQSYKLTRDKWLEGRIQKVLKKKQQLLKENGSPE